MSALTVKNKWFVHDGILTQYTHDSTTTKTPMRFSVFVPNQTTSTKPANVIFWLSGLTCTDENFCQKATQAFETAGNENIVLIMPDTSPRGANCPGDKDSWDFGEGAGFYLNAQTEHFKEYYNMYDYVTIELYNVITTLLTNTITNKRSIMGHSMGGYGALHLYLKSGLFTSCSAFAPISNPINCPWGQKAFTGYIGPQADKQIEWENHDPCYLIKKAVDDKKINVETPILIEQGLGDKFYIEKQLLPENFIQAAKDVNVPVVYNGHEGFDHSYFFVTSFIVKHVKFHAEQLSKQ